MDMDIWKDELLGPIHVEGDKLWMGEDLWDLVENVSGSCARTDDARVVLTTLDTQIAFYGARPDRGTPAGQFATIVQAELCALRTAIQVRVHGAGHRDFEAALAATAPAALIDASTAPMRHQMH